MATAHRLPNISDDAEKEFNSRIGLRFLSAADDITYCLKPEDIFWYAYAVFHSLEFRSRYEVFLKIDFPRLPITSDLELFRKLVTRGEELVKIHLLEKDLPDIAVYPADGDNVVENLRFAETERGIGRVWINSKQYFENVPTDVWNFHIGGYQVCHKWLKDRKGRTLNYDDLTHYKKIVSALSETIRLMAEIDVVIEAHDGFPFK